MADIMELIKRIAVDAIEQLKPTEIRYGRVVSISPLKIMLDPKMILDSNFLIVGDNFVEHSCWIKRDGKEERVTMHNGLSVGDVVVLLRMQGGQKFMIQDRIHKSSGLKLIGSETEKKLMLEELRALTNQGLDYVFDSGEVIFTGKPNNEGKKLPIGTELIAELINGYKEVRIREAGEIAGRDVTSADNNDWENPNNATVYLELKVDKGADKPLKIRMGHELIHALRITRGESKYRVETTEYGYYYDENNPIYDPYGALVPRYHPVEELEVTGIPYYKTEPNDSEREIYVPKKPITENDLRIEQKLPPRTSY